MYVHTSPVRLAGRTAARARATARATAGTSLGERAPAGCSAAVGT